MKGQRVRSCFHWKPSPFIGKRFCNLLYKLWGIFLFHFITTIFSNSHIFFFVSVLRTLIAFTAIIIYSIYNSNSPKYFKYLTRKFYLYSRKYPFHKQIFFGKFKTSPRKANQCYYFWSNAIWNLSKTLSIQNFTSAFSNLSWNLKNVLHTRIFQHVARISCIKG